MDFNYYQKRSRKTAQYPAIGNKIIYPTLGLLGESGEVAEKIKKLFRDKRGKLTKEYKMEIIKELGDILWYLSQMTSELGMSLNDVAKNNLEKIESRKDRNLISGDGDNR